MSSTNETNIPKLELSSSGIILPEESDILNGVIQDFKNAFGTNIKFYNSNNEFLLSTPQGQLVTSIAAMISDRNRLLTFYVNQVDPNYAVGRMQDGIGRIYFIERKKATNTTVIGRCYGKKDTEIPMGTKVKDQQGNVYQALEDGTLKDGYESKVDEDNNKHTTFVDITFECLDKGAVTCPKGTLTERYEVIQGWESITNLSDGVVGREIESQAQFEQRRRQSVAQNSKNSVDSIMAALLTLDEIEDAYVIENYENEEKKITDTLVLKPHSIYTCVYLRPVITTDTNTQTAFKEKIAKTIWGKKTPGCDLTGSTKVVITDDTKDINGNFLYCPATAPKYDIYFDYAETVPIYIYVEMADSKPVVGDPVSLIQDIVYTMFTGQDGSKKARIGSQILASQFYCVIQSLGDWSRIISLKVGFNAAQREDKIQVAINQIPILDKKNIIVNFSADIKGTSNG